MYLLCCAACWFLVQRDVRADGQALQFSRYENRARARHCRHHLDSRARNGARVCGEWDFARELRPMLVCDAQTASCKVVGKCGKLE